MANYPPSAYIERDKETLLRLMADFPLATFIVADGGLPYATPLPLVYDGARGELFGHLDANNPAAGLLVDGSEALAVFHGPSAYISPLDYTTRQLPTYNYQQVHVRGRLRIMRDAEAIGADLRALVDAMERTGAWALGADDARVGPLIPHIVAFRMKIDSLTGRFKLGQDKRAADRAAVHGKMERAWGCPVGRAPSTL